MDAYQRPKGRTETAVLMSFTNALGWFIVDWSRPYAVTTFCLFTILIIVGYLVIWFYWQGHNWARVLVLLTPSRLGRESRAVIQIGWQM